jgi:hypothetical protein
MCEETEQSCIQSMILNYEMEHIVNCEQNCEGVGVNKFSVGHGTKATGLN